MRKLLLASASFAVALATPAAARDHSPYVGIDGGLLFVSDQDADASFGPFSEAFDGDIYDQALTFEYDTGIDVDLVAGYDFGMFRVEAELAHKRAGLDSLAISDEFAEVLADEFGEPVDAQREFDLDDRVKATSAMVNALIDFGSDDGVSFTAGVGFGRAGVSLAGETDGVWAGQLLAGIRTAITDRIDVGIKYRYFRSGKLDFFGNGDEAAFDDGDNALYFDIDKRFRSHSLMASLTLNLGAPAVAAPVAPVMVAPPAPAPATQTCADGTVILANELCPTPVAPPVATPERG